MAHRVGLQPARTVNFLRSALHRHESLQAVSCSPGFSSETSSTAGGAGRLGDTVQGPRAIPDDAITKGLGEFAVVLLITHQPLRQGGLETDATRLLRELPDRDDHFHFSHSVAAFGTPFVRATSQANLTVEGFDGVLAFPAKNIAHLIDPRALSRPVPTRISRPTTFQILLFALFTHDPR